MGREFKKKNIVCFGGGTGMPSLLSGLKKNPWADVTAIVTMFDSGGSSGVLRDRFGILPPSDVMRCLVALSEDESVARKILMKRINHVAQPGHTGGNLLLMALEQIYGSYPDAVDALAQILSVRGRVVPVSLAPSSLCAEYADGSTAGSEVQVDEGMRAGKPVAQLFLTPRVSASEHAVAAIRQADLLVVGPGSPYTSVIPPLLPTGIREAIAERATPLYFIANLLVEGKGLQGLSIADNVEAAEAYTGRPFHRIICNTRLPDTQTITRYASEGKTPLRPSEQDRKALGDRLVTADLWTDPSIARHDSNRLAQIVFTLA